MIEGLQITEIRVKLTGDPNAKLRAFCSVTFADQFVVRDLKIIEGGRGAFIAMPSRKLTDRCPRCGHKNHLRAAYCNQCGSALDVDRALRTSDGRARLHADLAHPINSECRIRLHRAVLQAYHEELERSKLEGYVPQSFDDFDDVDDLIDDQYIVELQRRQHERERHRGQPSRSPRQQPSAVDAELGSPRTDRPCADDPPRVPIDRASRAISRRELPFEPRVVREHGSGAEP